MTMTEARVDSALSLRAGERVRLRPWAEIQQSLDAEGRTGKLPFMGEMLAMQGKTFVVDSRADKTCDTINLTGCNRAMDNTVHLSGVRCDGSAHGGCQAYCLLYFREEWLERSPSPTDADQPGRHAETAEQTDPPAELVQRLEAYADKGPGYYRCQATQALEASRPLVGVGHYWTTLRTRNVPLGRWPRLAFWRVVNLYQKFSRHFVPKRLRIAGGATLPNLWGPVVDEQWPERPLQDFQAGELVEVRSRREILATLDRYQRNKGLWFDQEMVPLCGKRGRVLYRVERLIDEGSGRMLKVKKDLYVVAGMVGCEGIQHKLCTRQAIAMLRDAWLRRVG